MGVRRACKCCAIHSFKDGDFKIMCLLVEIASPAIRGLRCHTHEGSKVQEIGDARSDNQLGVYRGVDD